MPRPDVAPRPVCRYHNVSPRGCFAGDKCRYLHGEPAVQKYAPYEENKTCRFYAQGYCKRGNECWFKHVAPEAVAGTSTAKQAASSSENNEDASCGICFEEKPALYGLLSGCSHAFCLGCIRQWRDPEGKGIDMTDSGIHKTCPMCRAPTKFVVPSSRFYRQGESCKEDVIEKYRQSMAKVPCRYFARSAIGDRFCPFGRDCFYQHACADGSRYEFTHGVDVMMAQWHRRRRRVQAASEHVSEDPLQLALTVLNGVVDTLASGGNEAQDQGIGEALDNVYIRDMLRLMLSGHFPGMHDDEAVAESESGPSAGQEQRQEEATREPWAAIAGDPPHRGSRPSSLGPTQTVSSPPRLSDEVDPFRLDEVYRAPTPLLSPPPSPPSDSLHHNFTSRSEDPRAPHNTSRSSQLTTADFAWMMERREVDEEENCT